MLEKAVGYPSKAGLHMMWVIRVILTESRWIPAREACQVLQGVEYPEPGFL